jgi:hypothetical protein
MPKISSSWPRRLDSRNAYSRWKRRLISWFKNYKTEKYRISFSLSFHRLGSQLYEIENSLSFSV